MSAPDSAPTPAESALVTLVRAYIARVGAEPALAVFHVAAAANRAGGKPLTPERVQAVLDGTSLPSLAMCEAAFDDHVAAGSPSAPVLSVVVTSGPKSDAVPLPVQPWDGLVNAPAARQPWETLR